MMVMSLLSAYITTAAAVPALARANASIARKQGEISLVVNVWGSARHQQSIALESDPRILLCSRYARRAHHDVALVWTATEGVQAVWLASGLRDYAHALEFARRLADGVGLPFRDKDQG